MGDAVEVVTPVALRMMLPLGQTGVACYAHTPRRADVVERAPAAGPVVLVPARPYAAGDGAPATAVRLADRVPGRVQVLYAAALLPEGPTTAPGVTPEGETARVPLPALSRWVLREVLVVRWAVPGGAARGFATWSRSGRGRWAPGRAWWRENGGWRWGRNSEVPV